MTFRTFGWVQNPSSFENLKRAVQAFDKTSPQQEALVESLKTHVRDGKQKSKLLNALKRTPLVLSYKELVGTGYRPRAAAPCDGIIQASIPSQNASKPYIDNWSSDGFVRWAHCLGFIEYDYETDSFSITKSGEEFSHSISGSPEEKSLLIDAMLSYPPATRILELLLAGEHLTKFDIGAQLGFAGEDGFTTLPQDVLLDFLATAKTAAEKGRIRADWEGTADKYARMISNWLCQLGLVQQTSKDFTVNGKSEYISHAFKITGEGLRVYRGSMGRSKHKKVTKNVYWEMFATKGLNREYIRTRRALILQELERSSSAVSLASIKQMLETSGFHESLRVIENDILGIKNCGIRIKKEDVKYKLLDSIKPLLIPTISITAELKNKEMEDKKDELLNALTSLQAKHINLVELATDGRQNRPFEMSVIQLLKEIYGFTAIHMGGGRKPDGGAYTRAGCCYDLILDTKAYSSEYSLPINQADAMVRYIEEYKNKNALVNPTKWWEFFPIGAGKAYYLFISGCFGGGYQQRLDIIKHRTSIDGAVLSVEDLLYGANYIKEHRMSLAQFESLITTSEIVIKGKF